MATEYTYEQFAAFKKASIRRSLMKARGARLAGKPRRVIFDYLRLADITRRSMEA